MRFYSAERRQVSSRPHRTNRTPPDHAPDHSLEISTAKQVDYLSLIGPTTRLRKVAAREYAGACPLCGGEDRFRVHLDKGWFCRQCHGEHWNDQIEFVMWYENLSFRDALARLAGPGTLSAEELERRAVEREKRDLKQAKIDALRVQEARSAVFEAREWEMYHEGLNEAQRALWRARGLSDDWIRYWRLGYCADKLHRMGDQEFHSPSLTIPYWRTTFGPQGADEWRVTGLKHRLLSPDAPCKYLPDRPGLGQQFFYTDPSVRRLLGRVLIVEGEIKAMVTWASLWRGEELLAPDLWVLGTAGKNVKPELLAELAEVERIYLCFDPDIFIPPARARADWQPVTEGLVAALGAERTRVLRLPEKIDDLILMGALNGEKLLRILEHEK